MPLDASFIGRSYPPAPPYEVGRAKIKEFADAIGDLNPVYRDPDAARAAGHPDVIAPPTFGIVVTMDASAVVVLDPQLGLDFSRVVHGEQRFVFTRPVRAGDVLTATLTVENVRAAAGNDLLTTRADVTDAQGEHVFSAYSTIVARGTA